jgi:hypothetical protein
MSRLLRVGAGLAGLAAGVTLVRRLTAPHVPERPTIEKPPSPSSVPAPPAPVGPARGDLAPVVREPTRQQLYEEARRLDIEGRSKMSKEELSQAVSERRRETP